MVNHKSRRRDQRQIWADEQFVNWLRQLKAKKELSGEIVDNLGELTRQIVSVDAIKEVERQILQGNPAGVADIRIRLDTRRLLR
jgi:hypothetical protein